MDDIEPIPPFRALTFDIINIDNASLIETFDTEEDAREFIKLHPNAENLAILRIYGDDIAFLD